MKNLTFLFLLCASLVIYSQPDKNQNSGSSKILINDNYDFISVNQIKMWISNNGDGSHNPANDGPGLFWPGGINGTKTASFEDGLIFGGKYNGEIRVNGNTHRQGLQAGKILANGVPDDPTLEKYRVYKILRGWENLPPGPIRDAYEEDYLDWPIADGAPYIDVNGNGVPNPGIDLPEYVGDETAWYVANDMDPSRSMFTYGTMPMGLEFQTTVFAFENLQYDDMIFKKYVVINKGTVTINDMYIAYWADVDLGDGNDDYEGCDTSLNMGYVYNSTNHDGIYGSPPPAIGYDILQGPVIQGIPVNKTITAFAMYINGSSTYRDPAQGTATGSVEMYNYLQGLLWNGEPFIDPMIQMEVKFALAGDPVAGTGWYEGSGWPGGPPAGDRRHLMSAGPFDFSPGDTQRIVLGILVAQGTDNIHSIHVLKQKDLVMQELFDTSHVNVKDLPNEVNYSLAQNYPNPFNPSTAISFSLPERSHVKLRVFDILGKEVAALVNGTLESGSHKIMFDPSEYGKSLSTGIYLYRIETDKFTASKKMIYLK